jgi:hypothetical protein
MFGGLSEKEDLPPLRTSGVSVCDPRACPNHTFRCSECVGLTGLSMGTVERMIAKLSGQWPSQMYRILGPNCVTFCSELCQVLGADKPPGWIGSLAKRAGKRQVMHLQNAGSIRCPLGHECAFQSQGLLARLVECVRCDGCWLELPPGQGHWHCGACDFTLCRGCSAELAIRCCSHPLDR